MSVHAYSQLWMLPYGYTTSRPADYKDQMRVARAATEALRAVHGTSYRYGPINEVIYQVNEHFSIPAKMNAKKSFFLKKIGRRQQRGLGVRG